MPEKRVEILVDELYCEYPQHVEGYVGLRIWVKDEHGAVEQEISPDKVLEEGGTLTVEVQS